MTTLARDTVTGRIGMRFVLGYLVLWGVLAGLGELDTTGRWGLGILAGVAVTAVAVERFVFRNPWRTAVRFLGLGRPNRRSLVVAAAVSALVLAVFPLTGALTGERLALVDDWPWLLVGLFAFNGLAEEIVWRGFVFRRLSEGRSFRGAVLWSMPFIAASHLPILLTGGVVVGLGALLVAAVSSVPLSRLYLLGRRTVWAPALVHTAIDSFKLVVVPAAAAPTFALLLIAFSLVVPLLVMVVRRPPIASR